MIAKAAPVFTWHDGTLEIHTGGWLILLGLMAVLLAFAERDRF